MDKDRERKLEVGGEEICLASTAFKLLTTNLKRTGMEN
jgi:hypothetical protein